MNIVRRLARVALSLVALMTGCGLVNETRFTADYGMPVPPKPHDPSVTLDSFSYTPPSPVRPGGTIVATVTTNKPTDAAQLSVLVGDPPEFYIWLNDYGLASDEVAGDGIWHGELELPSDATPAENLLTTAHLVWEDGYPGQELRGEDLTILEEGE